jgi:hypothetical protein
MTAREGTHTKGFDPLISDESRNRHYATASRTLLIAVRQERARLPTGTLDKLVWHDYRDPKPFIKALDPNSGYGLKRPDEIVLGQFRAAEREALEARRIPSREPCPHCGIRRDIGCKHIAPPAELTDPAKVNEAWEAQIAALWKLRLGGAE